MFCEPAAPGSGLSVRAALFVSVAVEGEHHGVLVRRQVQVGVVVLLHHSLGDDEDLLAGPMLQLDGQVADVMLRRQVVLQVVRRRFDDGDIIRRRLLSGPINPDFRSSALLFRFRFIFAFLYEDGERSAIEKKNTKKSGISLMT